MKTKVRTQEFEQYGAKYKVLQVIEHPYKDSLTVNVLGFLKFRQFNECEAYQFVGYEVEGENYNQLLKMAKIVRQINENSYVYAPFDEVCHIIGADFYEIVKREFIRVLDKGKKIFDVCKQDGTVVKRLISANELAANKAIAKMDIDSELHLKEVCTI